MEKNNRIEEQRSEFASKHREMSVVANYPPFSTSYKKRTEFFRDFSKEEERIIAKLANGDEDATDRMFSTLEAKWADDLEEARLYQKRYPENPKKAQEVVLEMEGLTLDSDDVPLDVF